MSRYFKNVKSYEDLKTAYRALLKENHPDNGGDLETMQAINIEYDAVFKIWKDLHEAQTGEKITETAESTRRHFYTQNGWEGSRYNGNLTLKEIAKIARAYVKEKYPTCKFSIRTKYASMCQELLVDLKEFPAKMYKTADDLRSKGITYKETYTDSTTGEPYTFDKYRPEVDENITKLRRNGYFTLDCWNDEDYFKAYEGAVENSNFYAIKTEYFNSVLEDVNSFINSYNYSDCDGMIDYFDVNFYYFGCGYEGCKQVEKTARVKTNKITKPATQTATTTEKEPLKPEELTGVFGEIVKGVEKLEEIESETPEQFAARCEAKTAEIFPAKKVEAITADIMESVNAILDGADTSETIPPEEVPTEDETATGAATETQETESDTAPDMFAELAKAYFTGKTASESRPKAKKETEPKNETAEAKTTTTADESEPEKPPKTAPGYTGETSDILSTEEAERLTNGEQVKRNDEETRCNRIFTAARYTDRTALLYSIDRYQYRDETREALQPGDDFHYIGFITDGKTYINAEAIREEMREDIAEAIRQAVPDEATARANAENCEEWQRNKLESAEEYGANNAADLFYKDEPPTLYLYDKGANITAADVIRYIENPAEVVNEYATEYAQSHAADIAAEYIKYNLLTAAIDAIKADKAHPAHLIKKIAHCIGKDEKTARIELSNGETVTAEANAVRYITRGYISEWYIKAADRQKLCKDEHGRAQDIKPEDIKAIYHGQRTLYRAA